MSFVPLPSRVPTIKSHFTYPRGLTIFRDSLIVSETRSLQVLSLSGELRQLLMVEASHTLMGLSICRTVPKKRAAVSPDAHTFVAFVADMGINKVHVLKLDISEKGVRVKGMQGLIVGIRTPEERP